MGFLDRLLGREDRQQQFQPGGDPRFQQQVGSPPLSGEPPASVDDQRAIERYQYLLRTAPPERVEQAHAEAFEQLSPEQRRLVLQQLSQVSAPGEAPQDDSPSSLARSATRAEMRQPGALQQAFGGGMAGAGPGIGTMLLSSVAGAFIGTAIAQSLLGPMDAGDGAGSEGADGGEASGDGGDAGADPGVAEGGGAEAGGFFAGGDVDAGGFDGGGFDAGF